MFDKLATVEARYEELTNTLGTATVQNDQAEYRKQAKALSEIEPLVEKYREYKGVAQENLQAEELAKSADDEMRILAEEELSGLLTHSDQLTSELKVLLLPKDPNDEKNVILEIRAGTGGDEAALFAATCSGMYSRYAERQGWKLEVMSTERSGRRAASRK